MVDRYEPTRRFFNVVDEKIANKSFIRYAIVSEVRTDDFKIRVKLLPEGVETNWLRIYWLNAGEHYATGSLPEVDSEVVVMFMEGHPEDGFVLSGGFKYDEDTWPGKTEHSYDIMDKTGNHIKLDTDGITILSDNVKISNGTLKKLVNETFLDLFMAHKHTDPLSTLTGPVSPDTIILPGHTTQQTQAG